MIAKICNTLTAFMVIILLALVAVLVGPRLFGYANLNVLTASMEPHIPVGSLITVDESVAPEDLEPGDVITLSLGGESRVTHRLMEKYDDRQIFITKGDNNNIVDSPVPYENLVGKVVMGVPKLGNLAANFGSREVIPYVMGFLVTFVLLIFIPEIFKKEA